MAQMEGLSTDEFLQKIGLQNSGLTETSTEEDLFNKLTIENYAKFSDKDIDEFKSMLGIDTLDNSMLWMEAQMLIKLKKIAKVEFGMDFEEFAEANALPPEITGDTTYGDAIPFLGNM